MNAIISGKQEAPIGSMTWKKLYSMSLSQNYSDKSLTSEEMSKCHLKIVDIDGNTTFLKISVLGSYSRTGTLVYCHNSDGSPQSNGYIATSGIDSTSGSDYVSFTYDDIGYTLYNYVSALEVGTLQ